MVSCPPHERASRPRSLEFRANCTHHFGGAKSWTAFSSLFCCTAITYLPPPPLSHELRQRLGRVGVEASNHTHFRVVASLPTPKRGTREMRETKNAPRMSHVGYLTLSAPKAVSDQKMSLTINVERYDRYAQNHATPCLCCM